MREIIIAAMLLAVTPASAQEGWQFKPAPPGHLFGPAFWVERDTASLVVSCTRGTPHIIWPDVDSILRDSPELLPRELLVYVAWHTGNPQDSPAALIGATRSLRDRPSVPVSFRIDDGQVETEEWETFGEYSQNVHNTEAVGFLRRLLPPAARLTISADFTDGETRSETFDLAGIGELLTRMAPKCAAVRPLVEDTSMEENSGGTGS